MENLLIRVRPLPKYGQGPYFFDEVTAKTYSKKALYLREKTLILIDICFIFLNGPFQFSLEKC